MIHQAQLTTCFIHGTSFLKVGAGADSFKKILTSKKKLQIMKIPGWGGGAIPINSSLYNFTVKYLIFTFKKL